MMVRSIFLHFGDKICPPFGSRDYYGLGGPLGAPKVGILSLCGRLKSGDYVGPGGPQGGPKSVMVQFNGLHFGD